MLRKVTRDRSGSRRLASPPASSVACPKAWCAVSIESSAARAPVLNTRALAVRHTRNQALVSQVRMKTPPKKTLWVNPFVVTFAPVGTHRANRHTRSLFDLPTAQVGLRIVTRGCRAYPPGCLGGPWSSANFGHKARVYNMRQEAGQTAGHADGEGNRRRSHAEGQPPITVD